MFDRRLDPRSLKAEQLEQIRAPSTFEEKRVGPGGAYVVYLYNGNCAVGFRGKACKADFRYSYKTPERRESHIAEWTAGIESSIAHKAAYKAEANKPHTLQVDDVLLSMWGYDQTNVDYYQVTKILGPHKVEIRAIASKAADTSYMTGECVPSVGSFKGEPMVKVVRNNSVKVGHSRASLETPLATVGNIKVYPTRQYSTYH